jgi:hypothetical protein
VPEKAHAPPVHPRSEHVLRAVSRRVAERAGAVGRVGGRERRRPVRVLVAEAEGVGDRLRPHALLRVAHADAQVRLVAAGRQERQHDGGRVERIERLVPPPFEACEQGVDAHAAVDPPEPMTGLTASPPPPVRRLRDPVPYCWR